MTGASVDHCDLVVLGTAAAALAAARAGRRCGLSVRILTEPLAEDIFAAPGRPPPPAGLDGKTALALAAEGIFHGVDAAVWSITRPGHDARFRLDTIGANGPGVIAASALVAAGRAEELVIPCPGWTLPGVIGTAELEARIAASEIGPGSHLLIAGAGFALAECAEKVLEAGGRVVALVDRAAPRDWLPVGAASPRRALRSLGRLRKIRVSGAAWLFGSAIADMQRRGDGLMVTIRAIDRAGIFHGDARHLPLVDHVVMAPARLAPARIARLLRAAQLYDAQLGWWRVEMDAAGRTSVPGLYIAEPGEEPCLAAARGELAALSAARYCGRQTPRDAVSALQRRVARASRGAASAARLARPAASQIASLPQDSVICRCEGVTRAGIDRAVAQGAHDLNQVKSWTRCGMGPCQGRGCELAAAILMAAGKGCARQAVGRFTVRPPLLPLRIDDLAGAYGYDDIRLPPAAPI